MIIKAESYRISNNAVIVGAKTFQELSQKVDIIIEFECEQKLPMEIEEITDKLMYYNDELYSKVLNLLTDRVLNVARVINYGGYEFVTYASYSVDDNNSVDKVKKMIEKYCNTEYLGANYSIEEQQNILEEKLGLYFFQGDAKYLFNLSVYNPKEFDKIYDVLDLESYDIKKYFKLKRKDEKATYVRDVMSKKLSTPRAISYIYDYVTSMLDDKVEELIEYYLQETINNFDFKLNTTKSSIEDYITSTNDEIIKILLTQVSKKKLISDIYTNRKLLK